MEQQITFLVIVLSIFLAVFLLLGIVLFIKAIQVTNRIKHIAGKADHFVGKLDEAGDFFKKTCGSLAVGRVVTKIFDHLNSARQTKQDKKEDS